MNRQAALPLVVVLTGPTGAGKSALALDLAAALADVRTIEIISVDSAQVYRDMDIGTAKPDAAVRKRLTHHLIDIRNPDERYSAGEFVRDARDAIAACIARGHLPLLVGGTMLYLRALYSGLAALPEASPALRREFDQRALQQGWPALHAELSQVDPQAAAQISRNDAQRIQRALEVHRLTGVPISQWQRDTHGAKNDFRWLRYAVMPGDRALLRNTLSTRFDQMMKDGLMDEVERLLERWQLTDRHPALRAVGYRQLSQFFRKECTLAEASQQAIVATMQLAKRQLTWLRREQELVVVTGNTVGQMSSIKETIAAALDA
jgi:tRNA dimethylallyltransferase